MRISDWSSDVCSSDLCRRRQRQDADHHAAVGGRHPLHTPGREQRKAEDDAGGNDGERSPLSAARPALARRQQNVGGPRRSQQRSAAAEDDWIAVGHRHTPLRSGSSLLRSSFYPSPPFFLSSFLYILFSSFFFSFFSLFFFTLFFFF